MARRELHFLRRLLIALDLDRLRHIAPVVVKREREIPVGTSRKVAGVVPRCTIRSPSRNLNVAPVITVSCTTSCASASVSPDFCATL